MAGQRAAVGLPIAQAAGQEVEYVVELKIDGLSANLTYENGLLVSGATRGDGENGEDVTANIKTIRSIPLRLTGGKTPELIEIRGEVYLGLNDFQAINKERKEEGEAIFANPAMPPAVRLSFWTRQSLLKGILISWPILWVRSGDEFLQSLGSPAEIQGIRYPGEPGKPALPESG